MDCPKERKVKLATFLLDCHAVRAGTLNFVTQEEFRKVFKDKFFPCSFCDAKRKEFMSFVQGDRTVAKYEKRFTEFAKYTLAFFY